MIYQDAVTTDVKTDKKIIKKYAIRNGFRSTFYGYLTSDGRNSLQELSEDNTYHSVDDAVKVILEFARRFPNLAKTEYVNIVGVELEVTPPVQVAASIRLIREIPLKTL